MSGKVDPHGPMMPEVDNTVYISLGMFIAAVAFFASPFAEIIVAV
ncbi:hypothetical protein NEOLI_002142 [Neolecta irregularis DAH-3]|uniref:Uncharacterized protein n=1 Tax=Neolecta irregularis (strain DAH-3) TaxID=1198029 RepID=A0A1U7LGJ1_NEOID|nr:hypothetical protein NEOLI_002142 [Neolecta irregularis DAH-3]|eukprot:OLL21767.1 hypothetical protein NEOLI_002142 [Neolecta irregularis DAH-3]